MARGEHDARRGHPMTEEAPVATRARTETAAASEAAAPMNRPRLAQTAAGPSLGSAPMRLRESRGPWTWMISAARLVCRNGRILPKAVPAWHAPGIAGNVRGDGGSGYVGQLVRQGYVQIPHDRLPCVAFGQSRENARHSVYLERHEGVDLDGRPAVQWTTAWTRYARLGHMSIPEHDHEGKDRFLEQAMLDLVCKDGKLSEVQIGMAIRPVVDRIHAEASNDTPRARRLIADMAAHLPREHTPDSVRAILQRLEIELPDPPT